MKRLSLILSIVALAFSAITLSYTKYIMYSDKDSIEIEEKAKGNLSKSQPANGLSSDVEDMSRPPAAGPCGDICDGLFK